ncbi:hypothetical protein [Geodermatophilus nigrescens]|uniref:Uncharacterized protein n=1 Tax=Geodermatophilus nigrescens TaxID=1070870 RepID=A0A1M5DEK5_9ACTN|nr:hypothetical protein [Geodermatophilus nigrescens]SHF65483.1 hypothetical protein SAMN05444351_0351 [Geodermatophilus nigrescens]
MPLEEVGTTLEQAVTGQGGEEQGGDDAAPPPAPGADALPLPLPGAGAGAGAGEQPPAGPAPAEEEGPVPPLPQELVSGLQSALTPLGVPEHCVQGVADGVRGLLNGVLSQDPAAAVQDLVAGLQGALTGLASGQPAALDPAPLGPAAGQVATDVEELLAAFQACLPALPAAPGTPAPEPAHEAPPPAAPAAAPVGEHPVRYLGYAPTGGDGAVETVTASRSDDAGGVPLALLGGGVLVAGTTGAAVSRVRSRAVRRP